MCALSSAGCRASCLHRAGRGGIYRPGESTNAIEQARIARTRLYLDRPDEFRAQLTAEIQAHVSRAGRLGLVPCVRLNGTSDIAWERKAPWLFDTFPDLQYYDYTKVPGRDLLPANYHLTFSRSEDNWNDCERALQGGRNVAAVFAGGVPDIFRGFRVFDGDATDLRFLDPVGIVVGLKAKGKAKRDATGFVVRDGGAN